MKKLSYILSTTGSNGATEIDIYVDINRDLTDVDYDNLRNCVTKLSSDLRMESIRLNPVTHINAKKQKDEILEVFGDNIIFVEEIPNGYDSDIFFPWFMVTTKIGHIKIGWRKRVISIDWNKTTINNTAEELFPDEDVTKLVKVIHAYGYEKAKEYINTLLNQ